MFEGVLFCQQTEFGFWESPDATDALIPRHELPVQESDTIYKEVYAFLRIYSMRNENGRCRI